MTRLTLTLQVRSTSLTPNDLAKAIGYEPENLIVKGADRTPARALPKANAWNGGLVSVDARDLDDALKECLDRYPGIADRVRALRAMCDDIQCTLYVGLAPLSREFILFVGKETMERMAALGCDLSIEYFDE